MVKAVTENKDMIILPFICYIYVCFLFLYLSCFSVSSWNLTNESLATGNQDFSSTLSLRMHENSHGITKIVRTRNHRNSQWFRLCGRCPCFAGSPAAEKVGGVGRVMEVLCSPFHFTSVSFTNTCKAARGVIIPASCVYLVSLKVENSVFVQTPNPQSTRLSCLYLRCLRGVNLIL